MLKAWEIYKSKSHNCECMVVLDDRLKDDKDDYVTVKLLDVNWFTIVPKDDLY